MKRVANATATPGGYSQLGDTAGGSNIITNLPTTTGINVGDYVQVSAGFTDIGRIRVLNKTANTLTLNQNANSLEVGVTVSSFANMYTDGQLGEVPRTVLNSEYMNMIQEEIVNLIEHSGVTLSADGSDTKQLIDAIKGIFGIDIFNGIMENVYSIFLSTIKGNSHPTPIEFLSTVYTEQNISIAGGGKLRDNGAASEFRASDTDITGDELEQLSDGAQDADSLHLHGIMGQVREVRSGSTFGFSTGDDSTYSNLYHRRYGLDEIVDMRRVYGPNPTPSTCRVTFPQILQFKKRVGADTTINWAFKNLIGSTTVGKTLVVAWDEDGNLIAEDNITVGTSQTDRSGTITVPGSADGKIVEVYLVLEINLASTTSAYLAISNPRMWI